MALDLKSKFLIALSVIGIVGALAFQPATTQVQGAQIKPMRVVQAATNEVKPRIQGTSFCSSNGRCFKRAIKITTLTTKSPSTLKKSYGMGDSVNMYYATAVEKCGHGSKLMSMDEAIELGSLLYTNDGIFHSLNASIIGLPNLGRTSKFTKDSPSFIILHKPVNASRMGVNSIVQMQFKYDERGKSISYTDNIPNLVGFYAFCVTK